MNRCRRTAAVLSLLAALMMAGIGANWPQFRGPGGQGVAEVTGLPSKWDQHTNVVWKTALPGFGASSPIIWGDAIYVTGYSGYGETASKPGEQANLTLNLTKIGRANGDIQWTKSLPARIPDETYSQFVAKHGYASGTPAADAQAVYVYFGRTGAAAYGHDGRQLWHKVLGDGTHMFGTAGSPVLYKNLVIINAFVECGNLVALDRATGNEVWHAKGLKRAWNTPALVAVGNHQELVVSSEKKLLAFDPDSGQPLWECAGIEDYICPSVVSHDGVVYAVGARAGTALAVRAGGHGDVTKTHIVWKIGRGSNVSSPVYFRGHLYWANEKLGVVYCADAKSGKLVYEKRLEPKPQLIYASPLVADGKIYYVSRQDGAYVLPAAPRFELLAHNTLSPPDDSVFNASPVPDGSRLLLRSDKFLYAIGQK